MTNNQQNQPSSPVILHQSINCFQWLFWHNKRGLLFSPTYPINQYDNNKVIVQAPLAQIQNSPSLGTTTQIFSS